MQQRRGTAAQWTAANPVLAAGEIGFETDTNQFKIGDGVNLWEALSYFKNLEDLGGSLDDYILVTARSAANGVAPLDADGEIPLGFLAKLVDGADSSINTLRELGDVVQLNTDHKNSSTNIHGIADTAQLATKAYADGAVTTHVDDTTNVHGIVNTANLALLSDVSGSVSTHNSDTTDVHGIQDTSALATKEYADTAVSTHQADTTSVHGIANTANIAMLADVSNHSDDTTSIHGISDTANLAYLSNISDHNTDTTAVHGIADTSVLETVTGSQAKADTAVSTHSADTTAVHGIADTSLLATTANVATAKSEAITAAGTAADTKVSTAVAALTKSSVGLANVDNTADASKPVSTAQATAIATAKSEAIASATAQVDALLTGAPAALNTLDELAAALGDDANFASTVTTSLGLKAPLASPTFTGTVTVAASGVAFTDGTQTKEGVASRTPIVQKTAAYTLSALTERDSLIEVSSATGVTITIPTNTAVAYPVGTSIDILQTGAGQVTIAPVDGTVTVNATPGLKLRTTWSSATLFKRAANTWVVFGDLTA